MRSLVSDGLIGLSPFKIGDDRPDLFIDLAVDQEVLDERVFSVSFQGDTADSFITFGGYDVDDFAVEPLTWHDNVGEYFWAVSLEEIIVSVGDTVLKHEQGPYFATQVVIDSGSSYILMPENEFFDFAELIVD